MFGFDNYLPSKWLDGVLAIHVASPKSSAAARPARAGHWAAKGAMTAAFWVAGAVSSAVAAPLPGATIEVVSAGPMAHQSVSQQLVAPPGYFAKLRSAISHSELLREQSIESDPEFAF